jgi:hypothetical protein
MPAKVVGRVTEAHRASMRGGVEHYVALAQSYRARGYSGPHPPVADEAGITCRKRGPMSFLEWGQMLAVLAESPDWVADRLERSDEARWRLRPAPGSWSALEVLCHLRDADGEILVPRLERMLAEASPEVPDIDMTGWEEARRYNEQSPAQVLEDWAAVRRTLLARLAPLSREDWRRVGIHSVRGPYPLAEMVRYWADHDLSHRRYWADHDLSHRRQMAAALGEFA